MTNSHEDYMLWLEVERRTREWGAKFQAMTAELHAKDEQIELARNRADMTAYARRRIAEEADGIAPELVGYISGDSVEQVEASILAAKQKTASIVDGIRQATFAIDVPSAPVQPGIPAQAGNPGPVPQGGHPQQPTAEQIAAMEPGSPEHLAARAAFGIYRSRGRGIFG